MVDLRLTLGRIELKNPVLVASGTFGYVREMVPFVRIERLGGVIPKTVTFKPRAGNPTPRTAETASGLLNAIGLDNDGIEHFITHHLPYLRTIGTAVIANIAGEDEDQFVAMAEMLGSEPGLAAIELNISCPNVSRGLDLGVEPRTVGKLVRRVREACPLPIIAKLTPNVTDIVAIAAAAAEGGADAVSLINTIRGMAVDWRKRRPILAYDVGGLSGPAIKPIALRMVWEVARALPQLPIIGIGGIATADDALEFMVAGASAIQVGTATFYDPTASERMIDDLTSRLDQAGVTELRQIIGTLRSNRG
jgi:dihydroorotate dehydrogenase (NAD+) catalytic subunit